MFLGAHNLKKETR